MSTRVRGKALTELIARCLREGSSIEIDGLGKFELEDDEVVFQPSNRIRVFLAYAQEDRALVKKLYDELQRAGLEPWMDIEKLVPGQNWPRAIQRAIEVSDFILVNFSSRSVAKRGQFQSEVRYALDVADSVPPEDIFLVPVRLSKCEVPPKIARRTQCLDLFPNFELGVQRLIGMMTAEALKKNKKRGKTKQRRVA
jgi:TIR domain